MMARPPVHPLPVPLGEDVLTILPALERALTGEAAIAPYADDAPPPNLPADADRPDHLALVVGTSGSTGAPKLAMLTAEAIIASDDATHNRFGGPGQWLLAMPARHIAGLQVLFRSIRAGTTPVALDHRRHFDAALFADASARLTAKRRYVSLTPTQVTRVLADPRGVDALRSFDRVLIGGAAVPGPLLDRVRAAGAHPVTSYGMSETAGGAVYDGRPLDGSAVRIVAGRVHVGGATLARGYLGLPERSGEVFIADADGSRWFVTDDAGHFDDAGLLHIDGRLDDLINTGGLKVLPRVVEEALLTHVPGVHEAVVVGVPHPEWGQTVAAALVLGGDDARGAIGPAPTVEDIRARLRDHLPAHALPRRIVVLSAIPLRGPGKPDRRALAEEFPAED